MIDISVATQADLPDIAQLEQQVFGNHGYPGFFFRQALDCWPEGLLVARSPLQLLGYTLWVLGEQEHRDAWLLSLAVASTARGQGVARQLLNSVLEKTAECRRLLLTVDPKNQAALKLYQSAGFVQLTREEDYFSPGEPRLILVRIADGC